MSIIREASIKINADTTAAVKKIRDLEKVQKEAKKNVEKSSSQLGSSIRNAFIGFGAIAVGKELMDMENALISAKFAISGLDDPKNFTLFKKQVNDVAKLTGQSQLEVTKMAINIGKSGTVFEDLYGDIMNVTSASVNWDMSTDEASEALAKQKAILQFTTDGMKDYASMVSFLADQANASERDILSMNTRVLGLAKDVRLTANETTALSTTLLNLGVEPERGATALIGLFSVMMKQGKKGKQGMDEIFDSLASITDETQRFKAIEDTFGSGLGAVNIKKLMDYTQAIKNGTSKAKDFIAIQKTGQQAANQMFNEQTKQRLATTSAQLGKLKATLFELAINVGTVVLPIIVKLANAFTWVAGLLTKIPSGFAWTTVAAIGIGFVLSKMLQLFKLLKAFRILQKSLLAMEQVSLGIKIATVALTNPLLLAAGAVAFGGAAYAINKALNSQFGSSDAGGDLAGANPLNSIPSESASNLTNTNNTLNNISSGSVSNLANTNNSRTANTNNTINVTQNISGAGNPSAVAQNSREQLDNMLGII